MPSHAPAVGGTPSFDAGSARLDAADGADAPVSRALTGRDERSCERRGARDFMSCATLVTDAEAVTRCFAGRVLGSIDQGSHGEWLSERMPILAQSDFWVSGAEDEDVGRWEDGRGFCEQTGDAAPSSAFAPWKPRGQTDFNGEDGERSIAGTWRDPDCSELIAHVFQGWACRAVVPAIAGLARVVRGRGLAGGASLDR